MPIVEINNLSFTYAGTSSPSIRNIDLEVDKGEFILLTGPSGCGKTTFCRCLNGLIPNFYNGTFDGSVKIHNLDTTKNAINDLAKHIGMVFQNPENQLFSLSVERDIAFGPENLALSREEIKERIDWALKVTDVNDLRDMAPYELSGGQQQSVAIASVLAMKPKILVLDEPTSFLDPKSASDLLKTISDLNSKLKLTIILIEHRLDLASKYVNRVLIMNEGKIISDGPPSDVYNEDMYLLGVGIPKITLLFYLLKKDGIKIKKVPVYLEDAVDILRKRLQ